MGQGIVGRSTLDIMKEKVEGLSNEEILEKSVITTDAIASQGKLNPEQAKEFLDFVWDIQALKGRVRMTKFRSDKKEINKISVHKRVAVAHAEATDPSVRRGIKTSKVEIQPENIMVPFELSDDFELENIEGESIEQRVIRMMATQLGNDMEEMQINGDKLGRAVIESEIKDVDGASDTQYVKDTFLALQDGWMRLLDSGNIYDAENNSDLQLVFAAALKKLPEKWKRRLENLAWMVPTNLYINYMHSLSNRQTALGDTATGSMIVAKPYGVPMLTLPLLPMRQDEVEHVTLTGTTAVGLRYKPIDVDEVIVTPTTITFGTPIDAYVEGAGNDYVINEANGTIARDASGTIASGATVKVTYKKLPIAALTYPMNFVVGLAWDDISIERDREIWKKVHQFALSVKMGVAVEETDGSVKIINIKDELVTP